MSIGIHDKILIPAGYQQITVFNAAAVKLNVPTGATYALLTTEAGVTRWRDDGTVPTTTVGSPIPQDQDFWYTGAIRAVRVIGVDAAAILNVSYYK